jgi:hypothetical protein
METPAAPPSPSTDDGIYELEELASSPTAESAAPMLESFSALAMDPAPPVAPPVIVNPVVTTAPAAAPASASKPPKGGGLLAKLGGRFRTDKPVPKAEPDNAVAAPAGNGRPAPSGGPKLVRKKRKEQTLRFEAPAWGVSLLVHLGVLGALGLASLSPQVRRAVHNINAAMIDTGVSRQQAEELVHIYAEPTNAPRDQAVTALPTATPGAGTGLGTGTGPPSATPRVGVSTNVGERTSLPAVNVVPRLSGIAMMPTAPTRDLGGGGMIAGDVTMGTKDVGEALDQLAREILRHLEKHKLTVVWLFDESGSMKDDQQAIKDKFSRISTELKLNIDDDKRSAGALNHVIVGFGDNLHYELRKPTTDIDAIGKAIDRLKVDETGTENSLQAITTVVNEYGRLIGKDRRLLIVLATDESGDDGAYVEEARQALVSRGVPLYVIGRQSLFGYEWARLLYIDPVTKDHYWPTIRRGPETAGIEALQWDGLHDRWDEQPSGFAPYELARLAKDSGGIYFLLPSEENMRVRQREKAYSIATLKEYVPDYESRMAYKKRLQSSPLRSALFEIIESSKGFSHRRPYPIEYGPLEQAILEEVPKVRERLTLMAKQEKRLRDLQKLRDREPEKRWQAAYDLMLAQMVTYQVKGYEYLACIDEMVSLAKKGKLKPSRMSVPNQLEVYWVINHSPQPKAPKKETEKHYAEARRLLELVIQRHPKTPWADLAQDEINRGLSCQWNEESHSAQYNERWKLVPKY